VSKSTQLAVIKFHRPGGLNKRKTFLIIRRQRSLKSGTGWFDS
jgi:hypothetical protein